MTICSLILKECTSTCYHWNDQHGMFTLHVHASPDNDLLISLPLYFEEMRRLVTAFTGGSEELVLFINTSGGLGPSLTPTLSPCIASSKDCAKIKHNLFIKDTMIEPLLCILVMTMEFWLVPIRTFVVEVSLSQGVY